MTTGAAGERRTDACANVDAIFFLGHRDVPLDAQQRADLAAFVHDEGKGFVAAHTALTAFESWPEFGETARRHATTTIRGTPPPGTDHQRRSVVPGDEAFSGNLPVRRRVLPGRRASRATSCACSLRLDVSKMPPNPQIRRTDGDFPLAWAKTYGKGRVFYSSLGHAAETWDNRNVAQILSRRSSGR